MGFRNRGEAGGELRRVPGMNRMNVDLRILGEHVGREEVGSQATLATLPKYEIGAPPPAYLQG